MLKQNIKSFYYVIIPILYIGISTGFTSFLVGFLALIPLLFLTTRHTAGFFLVMYGGQFGGVIRTIYPWMPVYGLVLMLIGALLLWDVIEDLIRHHNNAILILVLTLAIFGLFYIGGPLDRFSKLKYKHRKPGMGL